LPRTAGSTNGPATCNDVRLPSGDASAGEDGTIQQEEYIDDDIEVDDDDGGFGSSDDPLPWRSNKYADNSVDKEGEPNKYVMKLYEELLEARANPLGLDRFSCEERFTSRCYTFRMC
jgi:hypothetical protein